MEWNHEAILQLISLYERKPELWDASSNLYHLKNKKNDAWQDMARELNCDVELIKGKMASLLSSLRREKAKMRSTIGTGKGRNEVYVSKWFAFPRFAFLTDKDKVKETIDTESDLAVDYTLSTSDSDDMPLDVSVEIESSDIHQIDNTEETSPSSGQIQDPLTTKRQTFMLPKGRASKRKPHDEDPRVSAAYDILKNVTNVPKDECSTFGQHIATKLHKFDEKVRSVAMHFINNVIFDAEMGKYNNYLNNSYNQTLNQSCHQYTTSTQSPTYSVNSCQSNQSNSFNSPQLYVTPSGRLNPQVEENRVIQLHVAPSSHLSRQLKELNVKKTPTLQLQRDSLVTPVQQFLRSFSDNK